MSTASVAVGLPRVGHSGAHRRTCAPSLRLPCHPSGARVPACAVPPQPTRTAMPADPSPPHSTAGSAGARHTATAAGSNARPLAPPCADAGAIPAADQASWARGSPSGATGSPPPPTRRVRPCCRSAACPCPCPCPSRPGQARPSPPRALRASRALNARCCWAPPAPAPPLPGAARRWPSRRRAGPAPLPLLLLLPALPLPRFLAEEARLRVPSSRGSHAAARVQRHAAQPDGLRPAGGDQRQRAPIHPRRL